MLGGWVAMLCGWEVCYACQLLREGELCWKKEIKKNTGRLHLLYCQEDFNYIFYYFPVFPVESHFLCGIIFKYFVADICYLAIWDKKLT